MNNKKGVYVIFLPQRASDSYHPFCLIMTNFLHITLSFILATHHIFF